MVFLCFVIRMYGWKLCYVLNCVQLLPYVSDPDGFKIRLQSSENKFLNEMDPFAFLVLSMFYVDCMILCVCTGIHWILKMIAKKYQHWKQESELNAKAREFMANSTRLFTHPKDCGESEEYVARWLRELGGSNNHDTFNNPPPKYE
jgi:hypothetical protein